MHSKKPDRAKPNARKIVHENGLRLLRAVDGGLLFFEGTYRYRRVAISQGMEGLRRIVHEEELRTAAQRLRNYRQRKYIAERASGRRRLLVLTERGRFMKLRLELRCTPLRSDGKYLIVAFDVPERQSAYRKALRSILRECGFVRLQDSVWRTETSAERPLA